MEADVLYCVLDYFRLLDLKSATRWLLEPWEHLRLLSVLGWSWTKSAVNLVILTKTKCQGCHATGKTGKWDVHFCRQGKHREFTLNIFFAFTGCGIFVILYWKKTEKILDILDVPDKSQGISSLSECGNCEWWLISLMAHFVGPWRLNIFLVL